VSQNVLYTSSAHESGTKAALDISGGHESLLTTTVGLRAMTDLPVLDRTGTDFVQLYGELGWIHGWRGASAKSHNQLRAAGENFTVEGVDFERDAGFVEVGIHTRLGDTISLDMGYQGHFGRNLTDYGATGHLNFIF